MNSTELKKADLRVTLPILKVLQVLKTKDQRPSPAESVYKALIQYKGQSSSAESVYKALTEYKTLIEYKGQRPSLAEGVYKALIEYKDQLPLSIESFYKALIEQGKQVGLAAVYGVLTNFNSRKIKEIIK